MKNLILYLTILFLAIFGGLALYSYSGYLLIIHRNWKIGMPFWFALIAFLIIFTTLYIILRLISSIKNLPKNYRISRNKRLFKKANQSLEQGILKLAAGSFKEAETLFLQKVEHTNIPMIHYLFAAYAAEQQNNHHQCNEYLYKAYSAEPNKEYEISLMQAKLQFDRKQFDAALCILNRFKKTILKQPHLLALLKDIYIQLHDWDNLLKILPRLRKYKVADEPILHQLEIKVYEHLLKNANDLKTLQKTWKTVPKSLRFNAFILDIYCKQLMQFEQNEEASTLIVDFLNQQWNESLTKLLGLIKTTRPEKLLKLGETWLKKYGQDATLLLTLGRIATQFQYWIKAEEYTTMSLNVHKSPEAYTVLGYIYEKTKQIDKACRTYREGNLLYHQQLINQHYENLEL